VHLAHVEDAIRLLQVEGMRVSVRNVRAFARGGSFCDITRLLRQWRAQGGVDVRPTPTPLSPADDFLRTWCLLDPAQSTSRLDLKHALSEWWNTSGTHVSWTTLKQALHRRGCYGTHGGHI
jgi:hypothetical protein